MSGKRQHTIPQFLLKGFSVPKNGGKSFFCRVFKRNTESYKANIINVGVQSYFYCSNHISDIDATITKLESDFARLLSRIKRGEQSALSSPQLSEMLVHLEMRTRNMRETMSQATGALLDRISDHLSEEKNCKAWMKKFMRSNSEDLRKMITEQLQTSGLPAEFDEPVRMLIHRFSPDAIEQRSTMESFANWESGLNQFVHDTIKSRHLQSLDNPAMRQERLEKYQSLFYTVLPAANPPVILGDSIVLFQVAGQPCYKNHVSPDDDLIAIYLPLDSNNVLVGASERQHFLPDNLCEATARCSLEFFVATENTDVLKTLQPYIGTEANLISDKEIKQRADDILFESNASLSINFSAVRNYGVGTVRSQENQDASKISLILLTHWGYQGFTLSPDMAENLSRHLALLLKQ